EASRPLLNICRRNRSSASCCNPNSASCRNPSLHHNKDNSEWAKFGNDGFPLFDGQTKNSLDLIAGSRQEGRDERDTDDKELVKKDGVGEEQRWGSQVLSRVGEERERSVGRFQPSLEEAELSFGWRRRLARWRPSIRPELAKATPEWRATRLRRKGPLVSAVPVKASRSRGGRQGVGRAEVVPWYRVSGGTGPMRLVYLDPAWIRRFNSGLLL
ncbi:hypothetical protein NL676_007114, partial [Syzygium grande]